MLFNLLSGAGFTSSVEAEQPDTLTIIMIIVAMVLFCIACFCLMLYIHEKHSKNSNETLNEVSLEEQDMLKKYSQLSNENKKLIDQMLNSLNANNSDKE